MRTITLSFILFFCFCIIYPVSSQTPLWEKETVYSNSVSSIKSLNNNDYIIVDNQISHDQYNVGLHYQGIILYKFNFVNGFYDSTILSKPGGNVFCANTIDIDGIKSVGYGINIDTATSRYKPYLFWFDNNLSIIHDTVLDNFSEYNIWLATHLKLPDNTTVISGLWSSINNPQDKGAYFIKLNQEGKVSIDKFSSCTSPPFDIIETPNSHGIYGVCKNNITHFNNDLSGDSIVWNQPNINTLYLISSALTLDSSKFLQVAFGIEPVLPPPDPPNETYLLFRDSNAQIIDTIQVGLSDSSEYVNHSALKLSSEENILMGLTVNKGALSSGYSAPCDHDILIRCLTKNGAPIWKRKISANRYLDLQTITPLNDGGCIIAGTIWNWISTWPNIKDNIFIGRLLKNGNLVNGVPDVLDKSPKIYPNPVSDYLVIDWNVNDFQFILFSVTGEIVFETHVLPNQNITLPTLDNGLYLYYLKGKGKHQSYGKIVIMK